MPSLPEGIVRSILRTLPALPPEREWINYVEQPPDPGMGDYAFPCFVLSKHLKKSPALIAEELAKKVKTPREIERVEARGPYLNFFVKPAALAASLIPRIKREKGKYGKNTSRKGKRIMVEYSSPNSNKPLHIGHVRNDCIGMAISRALEAGGAKITRANLINDRGIHICKTMLAYQKWGNEKTPASEKMKGDAFAGKLYVQFEQHSRKNPALAEEALSLLRKWEEQDPPTRALWKRMNQWVLQGFKKTYADYGDAFDVFFFESEFYNKATPLLEEGERKGLFKRDDHGGLFAELKPYGMPNKVVLRGDGTSIYLTNDLALTPYKFKKYNLDEAIWVVANEQNLYFRQLFKILECLGKKWVANARHLSYGLVMLPEGTLKSREGRTVDADRLLSDLSRLAVQEIKVREPGLPQKALHQRAHAIALGAIKFFMLKVDANKDLLFYPEKAISFEGESGPYVQYTYARARSILRKSKAKPLPPNWEGLRSPLEKNLLLHLSRYPATVEEVQGSLSPHGLCQYLLSLCAAFNAFYHEIPVLKAPPRERAARLALVGAVTQVIRNGLEILHIPVLERM